MQVGFRFPGRVWAEEMPETPVHVVEILNDTHPLAHGVTLQLGKHVAHVLSLSSGDAMHLGRMLVEAGRLAHRLSQPPHDD